MKLFVILLPIWLFIIIFPPTVQSDNLALIQFGVFIWLPLAGILAGRTRFLFGPIFRERLSVLTCSGASLLAITASALLSEDPFHSLGFVVTVAVGLMCCAGIWGIVRKRMRLWLSIYAVLGAALAAYAMGAGGRIQGRLTIGDAHPNYLGLISFGVLMCSLAIPSRILAGALIGANLLVIVETQSRSALASALLGLMVFAALKANQVNKRQVALALAGMGLLCAVLLMTYYDNVESWVSSLFFLNDKYRGLGTGFTGRVDAWQEALALFFQNPAFGVGFRMHERYMTTLSSAHNGYLSLLAEVGVAGVIPLVSLTLLAGRSLFRKAISGDPIAILGMSYITGYALLVIFERLFLNMGNPTSILAWMFLLIGGRGESFSRAKSSCGALPDGVPRVVPNLGFLSS